MSSAAVPAVSLESYRKSNEQLRCAATTALASGPVYSAMAAVRWPALVAQSEPASVVSYFTSGLAAAGWVPSHTHVPGRPHAARMRFR